MAETNKQVPNGLQNDENETYSKALIIEALGGVDNADLIDLLSEWRMENSLYIYPLMEMKGYEIDYSYEIVTFKHPKGEPFQVAVKSLKDLCFKVIKARPADYRLERLLVSYLQCNVQQTYCVFDQWGYFPNGNKEILATEDPDVFIVDKQRKVAVSHSRLLAKLNELLQVNEALNAKYSKLWQGYKEAVAERYPEEFAKILLADEPIRKALAQDFYHRDMYGLCFVELSGNRVLRIPTHILKDFTAVRTELVVAEEASEDRTGAVVAGATAVAGGVAVAKAVANQDAKKSKDDVQSKQAEKPQQKAEPSNQNQGKGRNNNRSSNNNQRQNNGRRGRYEGNGRDNGRYNPKFNVDRYLISEDELNYIVPVGWRNQLLNWGCVGRFFLDIWIAIKLVGRIRKNRD